MFKVSNCPKCGSQIVYQGLSKVECDTSSCSNFSSIESLDVDFNDDYLMTKIKDVLRYTNCISWFKYFENNRQIIANALDSNNLVGYFNILRDTELEYCSGPLVGRLFTSFGNLRGANLNRFSLCSANLDGLDLCGTNLIRASLACVNLTGADLTNASLQRADLFGANLSYANLAGANLTNADLRGADLGFCNLTNTVLTGTILEKP